MKQSESLFLAGQIDSSKILFIKWFPSLKNVSVLHHQLEFTRITCKFVSNLSPDIFFCLLQWKENK